MERQDALHDADSTSFPMETYLYYGLFLFDVIFECYSLVSMDDGRPSTTAPDQCRFTAHPVPRTTARDTHMLYCCLGQFFS